MGVTGGRVRTQVCLVVVLIDDFNDKVIAGSRIRMGISNEKPPIRKAEGYYVFTNLKSREVTVSIESPIYEKQSVFADLDRTGENWLLLKVRMIPNRAYPIPVNTICVEGRAEPGSTIHILSRDHAQTWKLLFDYDAKKKGAEEIGIFHSEDMDIEGKTLFIENREKTEREFFCIVKKSTSHEQYELSKKLTGSYKKIGTSIYPVYSSQADENGYFFIPIFQMSKGKHHFFCEAVGTRSIQKECEFRTDILYKLNLTGEVD